MPVGDHAVRLAEMLVVCPEQAGRCLRAELERVIGADRIDQVGVDCPFSPIREGGRNQHVWPAVLQGVGDFDIGIFLPRRGDQTQRNPPRLTKTRSSSATSYKVGASTSMPANFRSRNCAPDSRRRAGRFGGRGGSDRSSSHQRCERSYWHCGREWGLRPPPSADR